VLFRSLRLELRKLRGFLNSRADDVFTLESKQLYLHLALEERTREISLHKDMMKVQIKNAEEERHSACTEFRDRVKKVETLKRRYEILMSHFDVEEETTLSGTSSEDHSQAYYVIKASQRREELQREGDDLDGKIRKAEKEIKALENTLKMMNDRNEEFRMNIYKAELNSKDVQHQEMLNEQYKNTMNLYKEKREVLQDLQSDLANSERALSQITSEESARMQSTQILEVKLSSMKKDIAEQEAKRKRAKIAFSKLLKEVEKKFGSIEAAEGSDEISDCKLRELKDKSNVFLTEANKIADLHPECRDQMQGYFQQAGIQIPTKPISRVGSRANSVISSVSGSRSGSRASLSQTTSVAHSRVPTNMTTVSTKATSVPTAKIISTTDLSGVLSSFPDPKQVDSSIEPKLSGSATSLRRATGGSSKTLSKPPRASSSTALAEGAPDFMVKASSIESRGLITGADRIKRPARTGSMSSVSSRGSQKGSK